MKTPLFIRKWMSNLGAWQSPSWRAAAGIPVYPGTGKQRHATQAESESLTACYRCCNVLASMAASLPLGLFLAPPGGGRQLVADTDVSRCVGDLSYQDKFAFFYASVLSGNGYFQILRNDRGGADKLQWIASWRVSIETNDGGEVRYRIAQDSVSMQPEQLLEPSEVIHLKFNVTGPNDLFGTSPAHTLSLAFGVALQTRELQEAVSRNGSIPGGYLYTENKLGAESAKRLKEQWGESLSGENRGKTPVLDGGMRYEGMPIGDLTSLQQDELSRFNISEISRAYGVPLSLLSEVSSINYSTSSEESRSLVNITLKPWVCQIESALNHSLLTRGQRTAGVTFKFDVQQLLIGSGTEKVEYFSKAVNGGLLDLNEARLELGYDDVAGGETIRCPANTYPLDAWLKSEPKGDTQPGAVSTMAFPGNGQRTIVRLLAGDQPTGSERIRKLFDKGRHLRGPLSEILK